MSSVTSFNALNVPKFFETPRTEMLMTLPLFLGKLKRLNHGEHGGHGGTPWKETPGKKDSVFSVFSVVHAFLQFLNLTT
jgi:hypothetical protein